MGLTQNGFNLTVLNAPLDAEVGLPGFSAFCANLHPHRQASNIGYLPLIPASPTNPTLLKEEMKCLVNISHALGDKEAIITGNQDTCELAVASRDKHRDFFGIIVGRGPHKDHNYIKAKKCCKLLAKSSGMQRILLLQPLCVREGLGFNKKDV